MERASAEGFRAGAVHHHNKAQHALGKNLPHEIETLLSGVPNRYRTRSSSTVMRPKVHCHRGGGFDRAFFIGGYPAFRGDNINFTDRLNELVLPAEWACHYHFDRLHSSYPSDLFALHRAYAADQFVDQ